MRGLGGRLLQEAAWWVSSSKDVRKALIVPELVLPAHAESRPQSFPQLPIIRDDCADIVDFVGERNTQFVRQRVPQVLQVAKLPVSPRRLLPTSVVRWCIGTTLDQTQNPSTE